MPQFKGSISEKQADAILDSLWKWNDCQTSYIGRSKVAAIVYDACHEDITLQPLHDAYAKRKLAVQPDPNRG